MSKKERGKHSKDLDKVMSTPSILGLESVVLIGKELILIDDGQVYGEIDHFGYDLKKGFFLNEYKCNNKYEKACMQLRKSLDFLKRKGVIDDAELVYSTLNYEVIKNVRP